MVVLHRIRISERCLVLAARLSSAGRHDSPGDIHDASPQISFNITVGVGVSGDEVEPCGNLSLLRNVSWILSLCGHHGVVTFCRAGDTFIPC